MARFGIVAQVLGDEHVLAAPGRHRHHEVMLRFLGPEPESRRSGSRRHPRGCRHGSTSSRVVGLTAVGDPVEKPLTCAEPHVSRRHLNLAGWHEFPDPLDLLLDAVARQLNVV